MRRSFHRFQIYLLLSDDLMSKIMYESICLDLSYCEIPVALVQRLDILQPILGRANEHCMHLSAQSIV